MNVAVLTGGGDCPGLNAVIRAVVRRGQRYGFRFTGVRDGWLGLLEDDLYTLEPDHVRGILHLGGTILGTSRVNPFTRDGGSQRVLDQIAHHRIDAIVAIGGEGTLTIANRFVELGVPIVAAPKTIDNDLAGTDYTFGFDTAVEIATEAIDRLHTTAEAHRRVIVCEVMGRHAGHIAVHAGIAGGAHVILIPEVPVDLEAVCAHLRRRQTAGKRFSIVVVAEGTLITQRPGDDRADELDAFGHVRIGGVGAYLTRELEARTGIETRSTVLGHIQRGGTPTARDRVLGTRYGVFATDLIAQGTFGVMAAIQGDREIAVPLAEATRARKTVDPALYAVAEVFFG